MKHLRLGTHPVIPAHTLLFPRKRESRRGHTYAGQAITPYPFSHTGYITHNPQANLATPATLEERHGKLFVSVYRR